MARESNKELEGTKALMGALLRQPPKHHDEMKVGKKSKKRPRKKRKAG